MLLDHQNLCSMKMGIPLTNFSQVLHLINIYMSCLHFTLHVCVYVIYVDLILPLGLHLDLARSKGHETITHALKVYCTTTPWLLICVWPVRIGLHVKLQVHNEEILGSSHCGNINQLLYMYNGL